MNSLWQYGAIRSATARANSAMSESNRVREKVHEESKRIHERVERLVLLCESMWELLCERTNLSDDDLKMKMVEIDRRDGVEDGKVTATVRDCPKCDAKLCRKFNRCLFCGFVPDEENPFDTL